MVSITKIESKAEDINKICRSCIHFDFCAVYWGTKCKRQGGKVIPRMKANTAAAMYKRNKLPKSGKQIVQLFEPIRTKVSDW
jgi:hypothetical protein